MALNFLESQVKWCSIKPRGRKYSVNDKILALAMMKRSGRGYNFLQKLFYLPSRQTLTKFLRSIPFETGINNILLEQLKLSVSEFTNELDKHCVLLFDEVSLEPGLSYNLREDKIIGFADDGEEQSAKFADHALVFMVKGIHKKWKQPFAYTFCQATTTTLVLIKLAVRSLRDIGLNVVASICDQGTTNCSAISTLLAETDANFVQVGQESRCVGYIIDNVEVVHLYDPPHLLKGIWNQMLSKHVAFVQDGVTKHAKWSDVISLYENDPGHQSHRLCPALTDKHIYPDKIPRMRVKYAAQVFSQRVSATMRHMTNWDILRKEAVQTADFFIIHRWSL